METRMKTMKTMTMIWNSKDRGLQVKKSKKHSKNKRRGKLVSKIENDLAKDANTDTKPEGNETKEDSGSGLRLRRSIKRKPKDKVDVDDLRGHIQKLCQSTNPLAKCMDFVNDDIEAMNLEIDKWKGDYQKHSSVLEEKERKTEEMLSPIKAEILNVDKQVKEIITKIQEAKARIAQNDSKITEMLRFVVNAHK